MKNCIRDLRRLKITLSGDSRLITTWDEICVQVQEEHSFYWYEYEGTILNFIVSEENKLEEFERYAIWFQTEEGIKYDEEYDSENYSKSYEITHYIKSELLTRAGNWSNKRIRDYLAR